MTTAHWSRRPFFCSRLAAFVAGCGSGGSSGGGTGGAREVRIPLGAGGVGFLPLLVMKERKLIESHAAALGVDVRVRWIDLGGPAVMNDALLSGSVDFIAAGPPAFITLWDRTRGGADVRGVAAMASLPMYLNTTADRLETLDDLGAQDKIAVTAVKVSIPSIAMQMYAAEHYGIGEASRFDRYTVTMTHADAVVALLSGANQIDAHFTSPPFHQRELKDSRVHTVLSTDAIMHGATTFTMLSTTAKFHAANPADLCSRACRAQRSERRDPRGSASRRRDSVRRRSRRPASRWTSLPTCCATRRSSSRRRPANVAKYAEFMHAIGSIEHAPESWSDLFFPEIHGAAGS